MPSPPYTIPTAKLAWARPARSTRLTKGLTRSCYLMHDNLHWLDVPERVKYKFIILTRRRLIGTAPRYLAADCVHVSEMAYRRHLRSVAGHQLVMPSYCLNSCDLQAFSVLGPRLWNSLPRLLRHLRETLATALLALAILWRHFFSQSTGADSALGVSFVLGATDICFLYWYRGKSSRNRCILLQGAKVFQGAKVPCNFRSPERKFQGTKVPGSESSTYGTFALGSESTWEQKLHNSWQSTKRKLSSDVKQIRLHALFI